MEAHLIPDDVPFAHRGMRGRVWRARESATKKRKKLAATRLRRAEQKAAR
jgi:hypothetical protein